MPHHSPVSTLPVFHVGSLWVPGFPSTCAEKSGLEGHLPSPSPCSHGRPVCSGPASARPLTVCCLAPAPGLRRRFEQHLHLTSARTSPSTGCPRPLSLGFSLGTWRCIVSLECLLSLLGLVSLQRSRRVCVRWSLGSGPCLEQLGGSGVVAPGDGRAAAFQADHSMVISADWSC